MFGFLRMWMLVSVFLLNFIRVFAQTTPPTPTDCALKSNTSCDECLESVKCLWCRTTKQCIYYPVKSILPSHSLCPLSEARWGLCWVNFQALIIAMSVIGVVIIITILVCFYCCCKCEKTGRKKEDAQMQQQATARKARHEERKAEMQLRHDQIRSKYGLAKDNPYARFEEN
ncbi:PTTG1 interacting protein b [Aplochiton taeniatus]